MTRKFVFLAVVVCLALTGLANASTIQYSQAYPLLYNLPPGSPTTATDWTQALSSLPMFNPALGVLTKVTLAVSATVDGVARTENLGNAVPVTLTLSATVVANGPGSTFTQVIPLVTQVFNAAAFDGVIDWGGTSGVTYPNLNNSASASNSWTDAATLAAYTGVGNFTQNFTATAHSNASGSGNLVSWFSTNAGAIATVTYDYNTVPEPATLVLLGSALLGLGIWGRKRFQA